MFEYPREARVAWPCLGVDLRRPPRLDLVALRYGAEMSPQGPSTVAARPSGRQRDYIAWRRGRQTGAPLPGRQSVDP